MPTKKRHARTWWLATAGLAAISTAAVVGAPAFADAGTQTVSHHGYEIDVPDTWKVVDLESDPHACIRFDEPAVYLGTPDQESDCPSRVVGRTAGIVISPIEKRSAAAGPETTEVAAAEGATKAKSVNDTIKLAVTDAGVLVSAAHNPSTEDEVRTALDSARLTDGAEPAKLPEPKSVSPEADPIVAPGTFNDQAFDACTAQPQETMDAWRESPYKAVGIYTSGINRGCAQDLLTPEWVAAQHANGWQFILTDVGLQAPCSTRYDDLISADPATARQQGVDGAKAGIEAATALGFGAGSTIFADIEAYDGDAACTTAVLSYLSGWTEQLRADGWLGGFYSSGASGVADACANYDNADFTMPDQMWFAWWNDQADTDSGQYCSNDYFAGQRIHQYSGEVTETHGGATVNIDRDFMDVG